MAMSQPNIPSVPVSKPDRRSGVTSVNYTDIPNYKRFEPTSSGVPEFDQDKKVRSNDIRKNLEKMTLQLWL